MRSLLIGVARGVWFAVPWIVAAVWIGWRMGWSVAEPLQTQTRSLRSFSLRGLPVADRSAGELDRREHTAPRPADHRLPAPVSDPHTSQGKRVPYL
jgi:hypothetical protein